MLDTGVQHLIYILKKVAEKHKKESKSNGSVFQRNNLLTAQCLDKEEEVGFLFYVPFLCFYGLQRKFSFLAFPSHKGTPTVEETCNSVAERNHLHSDALWCVGEATCDSESRASSKVVIKLHAQWLNDYSIPELTNLASPYVSVVEIIQLS